MTLAVPPPAPFSDRAAVVAAKETWDFSGVLVLELSRARSPVALVAGSGGILFWLVPWPGPAQAGGTMGFAAGTWENPC